jgi:isopenicillin-N N-acyltransferase like protein
MFPTVRVEGGPRERGQQYGALAREQVRQSVMTYRDAFAHFAGWTWNEVRAIAAAFEAPINEYEPRYLEEIEGIAEGADVEPVDVLAINVRTEILFAATARDARRMTSVPPECSVVALMGERTTSGQMLIGQNWDWLSPATETTVVLQSHQDDGPDFITVVEAGLLAKFGMNSAGIGLLVNSLVSAADRGAPGVPMHVLIRAIYDSETISDALTALLRARRSSSANYLLAHSDGIAVDVEAAAGDHTQIWLGYPHEGCILHTNHFLNPRFDGEDVSLTAMPDSPFRLQRLQQLIESRSGEKLDAEFVMQLLSDHAAYPVGVCCHPDPRVEDVEKWETVASAVIDLAARKMWLAAGSPCSVAYRELDLSGILSKPSAVARQPAMST